MICTLLLNSSLVINFYVIWKRKAVREFLEITKSIASMEAAFYFGRVVTNRCNQQVKISVCNEVTQFSEQFPPHVRHNLETGRSAGSAARRSWRTRRLLNSILGLLYLLTISSICYQQRQKNRKRRPTADEIKGKLGWNFYITLDGGALPAPPPSPPPPRSSSLRFSFADSLIN
jgi:hypothetical protein